jgi:hypothetical protein
MSVNVCRLAVNGEIAVVVFPFGTLFEILPAKNLKLSATVTIQATDANSLRPLL